MGLYCRIKKDFGSFKLDIALQTENRILALLGASGSGKSMTLRCIAGIEKPDEGKIVLNGVTLYDSQAKINLSPQRRKTGYLFQNYALFPNMTVEKNIFLGTSKKEPDRSGIVVRLIADFDLKGLEKRYPDQLSGGQKQRCALARIMAGNPEIIMLDEPLSALDSYLRWKVEQKIGEILHRYRKTVLYVSHNRDEVFRLCNDVAVIHCGRVEVMKEKWDLFSNPTTCQAALLSGCKNITPACVKNGAIIAEKWGWRFRPNKSPAAVAFIGVRSHHIYPAYLLENEPEKIVFTYKIIEEIEDVFGTSLIIRIDHCRQSLIRWELDKFRRNELRCRPAMAAVRIRDILLLSK